MKNLLQPIKIRRKLIKNRVVFPPTVYFAGPTNGTTMDRARLLHYQRIARGGAGLVIVEATCIDPSARLTPGQLGLWEDAQVESMRQLIQVIHEEGACVCVQLHHGGGGTHAEVNREPLVPTAYTYGDRTFREATAQDLQEIHDRFVAAAIRAEKAGADGVELHGAHGYFLSQMASPLYNRRTDAFGGSVEKRVRLACTCVQDIRSACGEEFIIGCRMGGYEPGYEEGIAVAKCLEQAGVDYLHVSWGHGRKEEPLSVPADFRCNAIVYSASLIRKEVSVPVIAVNEIRTVENGAWLVENGHADMVAYCRPLLATPEMIQQGESDCVFCKRCFWFDTPERCPGRKLTDRKLSHKEKEGHSINRL